MRNVLPSQIGTVEASKPPGSGDTALTMAVSSVSRLLWGPSTHAPAFKSISCRPRRLRQAVSPVAFEAIPSRSGRRLPSHSVVSRQRISPPFPCCRMNYPLRPLELGSAPRSLRTVPGTDVQLLLIPLFPGFSPHELHTPGALHASRCPPVNHPFVELKIVSTTLSAPIARRGCDDCGCSFESGQMCKPA